ncbi:MAG TPA: DNA-3-methyladenine glycosylase [Thermoflexia bacterium]|nr:DNA-3-methyladenine glycosylase [Thermoflexia bacterium]
MSIPRPTEKVNRASRLPREFYARATLTVARELLNKRLVRLLDGERLAGRIVEVEAYSGAEDQASHARCGKTQRNAAMFGPPGQAYIYLIYGIHHCLNLVTATEGYPAAILIRALEPVAGLPTQWRLRGPKRFPQELTNGPGKLCQALAIDRRFDQTDLCAPQSPLWVEDADVIHASRLVATPRIGVTGDERARSVLWRFFIRDNVWVSR